jgi:glycosyltransferase involved in cell wall biosynthesis
MKKFNSWDKLYVVIPVYNESGAIVKVIEDIFSYDLSVIVVDDLSSDDTYEKIKNTNAIVLRHPINLGQGASLQTGIEYALELGAEFICTFDGDGQHLASEIIPMFEAFIKSKADIALGSRFINPCLNIPRSRYLLLKLAILFTRVSSKIKVTDTHNGFRILSRDFCKKFKFYNNRMSHASEILDYIGRNGVYYIEHPVTVIYSAYSIFKGQKNHKLIQIMFELIIKRLLK